MDIAVANAVEMREHGHAGFVLNPGNQRLAAARNDHIDRPLCAQHCADNRTVLRRNQLHSVGGQASMRHTLHHRRVDRMVAVHRLATAAQDDGVARAQP